MRGAATDRRAFAATPRRAGDPRRSGGEGARESGRRGAGAVKTQKALKEDPSRATKVGEKWFPAFEASLIAKLVERDLPYYDPTISRDAFDNMCKFVRTVGLTKGLGEYDRVVATQFANLWKA
jgi:hypothetical protein